MIKINPFNKSYKEIIIEIFDKINIEDIKNIKDEIEIYNEDEDIIEKITIEDFINEILLNDIDDEINNDLILNNIMNITNIFYNYKIINYYIDKITYEIYIKTYKTYNIKEIINKKDINKEINNIKQITTKTITNKQIKNKKQIIKEVIKC